MDIYLRRWDPVWERGLGHRVGYKELEEVERWGMHTTELGMQDECGYFVWALSLAKCCATYCSLVAGYYLHFVSMLYFQSGRGQLPPIPKILH